MVSMGFTPVFTPTLCSETVGRVHNLDVIRDARWRHARTPALRRITIIGHHWVNAD
jgi:hypothetical protein